MHNILDTANKQESALIARWLEATSPFPSGTYEEKVLWKTSEIGSIIGLALSRVAKGESQRLSPKFLRDLAFSFETYPPNMTATALGL